MSTRSSNRPTGAWSTHPAASCASVRVGFRTLIAPVSGVASQLAARQGAGHSTAHAWLGDGRAASVRRTIIEIVAVTAWPSPLVIEAIADPGRPGSPLYSEIEDFATDFHVDQYRALELDLPDDMADIGSRRVLAARFTTRSSVDAAAVSLRAFVASSLGAQVSVAPLGDPVRHQMTVVSSWSQGSRSTSTRAPSG